MQNKDSEPLMRRDITYIQGVQMEKAVEIVGCCFFKDDEKQLWERVVRNQNDFRLAYEEQIKYRDYERCLSKMYASTGKEWFYYEGYCAVCDSPQSFVMDSKFCQEVGDGKQLNWRERLVCPNCRCNNRQRFSLHKIFDAYKQGMQIVMYEQNTDVFQKASREISDIRGFECRSADISENTEFIYEDITNLSLSDESVDLLIANDVFEHIEDYESAFQEASRVLKPGGKIMMTVPFDGNSNEIINRGEGGMVYQVFGWELLNMLKQCGFQEAYGKVYYSIKEGYLGYLPIYFEAYR